MKRSQLFGVYLSGVLVGAAITWMALGTRSEQELTRATAPPDRSARAAETALPTPPEGGRVAHRRGKRSAESSSETPGDASVAVTPPSSVRVDQPNVVLVVVCTLRRDQLSVYGAPPQVSPFIGKLAEYGAVFEDAWSSAPWTKAASTAIMTGHHAIQIGMIELESRSNHRLLADDVETLAERFDDAGYYTLGLTANPNTNAIFGFGQGFDDYIEATGLWREEMDKVSGRRVAAQALEALDARPDTDAPVYLRMMILDPHEPIKVSGAGASDFSSDGVPRRIARYRAMVHRSDTAIADLWRGLGERGLDASNTLLAVISDHGEGLSYPPSHGKGHGNLAFSSTVAMPWIVYGPGVVQGHRIPGIASQVDVMPTLLGLAGIGGFDGPGMDHSPALLGRAAATTRTHAFVDTWFQGANRGAVYTAERSCHEDFRSDEERGEKVRKLPQVGCYDQRADPTQQAPLAVLDDALVETLRGWRAEMVSTFERYPHTDNAVVGEAMKEQLAALGYVDGQDDAPVVPE